MCSSKVSFGFWLWPWGACSLPSQALEALPMKLRTYISEEQLGDTALLCKGFLRRFLVSVSWNRASDVKFQGEAQTRWCAEQHFVALAHLEQCQIMHRDLSEAGRHAAQSLCVPPLNPALSKGSSRILDPSPNKIWPAEHSLPYCFECL